MSIVHLTKKNILKTFFLKNPLIQYTVYSTYIVWHSIARANKPLPFYVKVAHHITHDWGGGGGGGHGFSSHTRMAEAQMFLGISAGIFKQFMGAIGTE
jgi:hypothetical protein